MKKLEGDRRVRTALKISRWWLPAALCAGIIGTLGSSSLVSPPASASQPPRQPVSTALGRHFAAPAIESWVNEVQSAPY